MAILLNPSGKDKAKELRKRIDNSLDGLAKAVDDVRASETFQQFLDVQARFHKYSWHNTLLICMQRPNATQVAGYRTWQKLGRQVCKGESGIMIFAPCPWKRETATETGETETEQGVYFKAVHVFDVAQTDGPDLPTVDVPTIDTTADDLLANLLRVAESRGIAVDFRPVSGGPFGASKHGSIDVDNSHATGQQAKTLAHELAHEALHWEERGPFTRSIAELEAESVAYVVCLHFGLNTEVRSSRYIALWDGDSGLGLDAQAERIRAYLALKGMDLTDIITDAGVSGGKPLAKREGGQRLLTTLKQRKASAVVMMKLDRGFRDARDCLNTVEKWDRAGVALHVIDLGGNAIDTTSAAGRFMLVVLAGAAEMERNLTRERTRSAMAVKRANGQRIGTVPYGFDLADDGVALVPNESEQAVIGDIKAMRTTGRKLKQIANALTERGVPTKTGKSDRWTHQAVARILTRTGQ